jgi:iron complex transport system ATP-binding protein
MITLENVSAGYGGADILKNISLAFAPGTLTGVIGPNGSGKSTLLKLVARLIAPTSGQITAFGQPLESYTRREWAQRCAFLPQGRDVPAMSVRQLAEHGRFPYLGLSRRLTARDNGMVDAALEKSGAAEFAGRPLSRLSGGERQKAYIAMLLAQDTELMLLDEPSAQLDIGARLELMAFIGELCAGGRTVVIVLHELSDALRFCSSLALLQNGALAFHGGADALIASGGIERVFGVSTCAARDGRGRFIYDFERR